MPGKGKGKRSRPEEALTNGYDDKKVKKRNGHSSDYKLHLSARLMDSAIKEKLKDAWTSQSSDGYVENAFKVIKEPFTCCSLSSFVQPLNSVDILIQELQELEFLEKNNDLYKFKQSDDLKAISSPSITTLRAFLQEEVKPWLSEVTGIDFFETVDIFCARYDYTDYLLCHDDELEGRRIAYIWYLVPPTWIQKDGGTLDLFDRDENGQPRKVVQSLVPSMNGFVFFEVTPKSFHQVAEVLTRDKTRLSIGGWFHARSVERPEKYLEVNAEAESPEDIDEDEFFSWINPLYLDPFNQEEIKENFVANSEICLKDFLQEDKYEMVCSALKSEKLAWITQGPANKRCFDVLDKESAPSAVQQCVKFLKSDAMFLLLSNLTGLNLHQLAASNDDDESSSEDVEKDKSPQACSSSGKTDEKAKDGKPSNPRCRSEIRIWRQGSYTLIHDDDQEQAEFALDARLFFNCKEWSLECGGFSSYVARDENEELLSAHPEENCLILVYRDADTLKFVKRVTDEINRLPSKEFNDISVVYYE